MVSALQGGSSRSTAPPAEASPAPPLPPGRAIHLPGRGTTFVREVEGPPGAPTLLLLHGWMVTADLNWFTCYEPLGERFRVLAIDHRGHGGGIRSWRPFRLTDCADDAAALARQLGVTSLIAIGYSMGGSVAQLLWRRHPALVDGLVLCATTRSFSGQHPGSQLYFASLLGLSVATRFTPRPVVRNFYGHLVRQRASGTVDAWGLAELQRNDTSTVLGAGWAIGRFESQDWIGSVDVPTAVVVTTGDKVVHSSRQRALARAIPGASVHEVEAGHAAPVTHPEIFVPALLDACQTVTSSFWST